ncbi:MAG: transcription-repair coupling factor, partial [Candidatus Hydrogenedentota bacterium]
KIQLNINEETNFETLLTHFLNLGYERKEFVQEKGEFSVKGSLIDIFPVQEEYPVRIDFFGDTVESIRLFDVVTQRSLTQLTHCEILPRFEILLNDQQKKNIREILEREFEGKEFPPFLTEGRNGIYEVFPLALPTCEFTELLAGDALFYAVEPEKIRRRIDSLQYERTLIRERTKKHVCLQDSLLYVSSSHLLSVLEQAYPLTALIVQKDQASLGISENQKYKNRFSQFVEDAAEIAAGGNLFLSVTHVAQQERIEHILSAYENKPESIHWILSPIAEGFRWENGALFTEKEIFGKRAKLKHISKKATQVIRSFTDLTEGDYVVHIHYGIGRFVRLKRVKAAGMERDFLELEYANQDKLYVPLDQVNLVHKYTGGSENPKLDYLGKKSSWEKTKKRVQESAHKLAEELIKLYAKRERMRGFAFPPDTKFQEEFEASFPYEETEDQLIAINEVKKDMESIRPMDRLICGDVGFGKTEVALRAAFKAVMAGKQVALLCPTTVLAYQHFQVFRERMSPYPISVDFLSRFKTQAEQKETIEKLAKGEVDIIIGTHALLSDRIQFKSLGLLIVDEEQRFGVRHKEAIKKLRENIDCLTLTATPIPRTLQLSLSGLRDLSLMETPPQGRMKIETHILEENEEIIQYAIQQELKRGGQVYILHNKVKTIDAQAARIRNLVPQAKLGVLHGQMSEHEIEDIMLRFYENEFDVLVTTTIIESGIDIPNVNTLLVLNAHELGLAQMYQLKGRVGRSDKQAYAYFFYPSRTVLSETANKRLTTLQEFDRLGSGFQIAMRDLEIRGAGNILGKEQSGDIMEVGLELYVQLLQEKMQELKNEPVEHVDPIIHIAYDFFFPDEYIPDTRQKMEFYKKLAAASTIEEVDQVEENMTDRFSKPPETVAVMVEVQKVRVLAKELKLEKIEQKKAEFRIEAGPYTHADLKKLQKWIQQDKRFRIEAQDAKAVYFKPFSNQSLLAQLRELVGILKSLRN